MSADGQALTPLQSAALLVKQAQARLAAYEYAQSEPIAVVGLGCRFPGAEGGPQAFWRLLSDGVDAVREVPPGRWNVDDFYDPDPAAPGKMNTRCGAFLERVDEFDAEFFGISPREAIRVDPQHRVLLEVAWEALENAGIVPADIAQTRTGVYVGVIGNDYALMQAHELHDMDVFSGTGSSHAILSNRLSYVLNLNGPSITLDTACSSSLVTVHLACQSLRRRETDMALAGGVNLILSPEMTMTLSKAYMMSPDGRCHTFDAAANGYVRGEGCGLVVLKRLSDAVQARDRILALIRGSAVNHDGRSNGLSAPNGPAQEAVIRAALADARLQPRHIQYIEAHGTGTRFGDPIEIEALREVFSATRPANRPLLVGSVKTNIGHLESAAGIAGLAKLIIALEHRQIPPHANLKTVNPLLRLDEAAIEIPTELRPWDATSEPRRAGVSSFGFGGTNGHVVVEEPPTPVAPENSIERHRHLLTLSARSPKALVELAGRYADFLEQPPTVSLADVCYTAANGRTHFAHRAAIAAGSPGDAVTALRRFAVDLAEAENPRTVVDGRPPRIAFLFTGQGAQYAGMGRELYDTQPIFRTAIDRCAEVLNAELDRPLLALLSPDAGAVLDQTGYTQPVMFALEYALAELWGSWGVEPAAVMGHSVGEFAAACVAGIYSLEDGLRLIARRAALMQALPAGGRMAAVFATEPQVCAAIESYGERLSIAALNGPENMVISGDADALDEVLAQLQAQGIKSKLLATSHAFHSRRMEPMLDELQSAAASIPCARPAIDIVSNLTGRIADESTYRDPGYWSRHARSPVRFAEGMRTLAERGCEIFLEIGPSPTLTGMGRRCLPDGDFAWLPSLRSGRSDWQSILESLGQLYVRGAKIDWAGFDRPYARRKVALPTYPFQRTRYWAGSLPDPSGNGSGSKQKGLELHPLLGRRLVAAVREQVFEAQLSARRPATLADHKIQGKVVMPGAAYLEMALAAGAALHGRPWCVRELSLVEPLLLDNAPQTVQTIVAPEGPHAAAVRVIRVKEGEQTTEPQFTTHAVGRIEVPGEVKIEVVDLAAIRARFTGKPRDAQWKEEALRKSGLEPGPTFSWFDVHWIGNGEALAHIRLPREADRVDQYQVHPGLLDAMLQLLGAILPGAGTGIDAYVPMVFHRLQLFAPPQGPLMALAKLTSFDGKLATGDVDLIDAQGQVVLKIEAAILRRVSRDWIARLVAGPLPEWCYELAWTPRPLAEAALEQASLAPGRWLIFDSRGGLGGDVAERLRMKGHDCTLVLPGGNAADRRAAVEQYLGESVATPQEMPLHGIVYLESLDAGDDGLTPDFAAARRLGWGGTLDVVHALSAAGRLPSRLWLVTRGAQAVDDAERLNLAQSPLWGMGRVIAAEHPEMHCTRIDLDPATNRDEADQLTEELWSGQSEDQIAYRGDERFAARLRCLGQAEAGTLDVPRGRPYRLEITSRGQLDNVALRPVERQAPGPGQVEIKIRATGLNFRDVLNVLNLYPGDAGPLGGECAGEIVAIGLGVERFKLGDAVVALAPASFASYVVTLVDFVAPKPEHLSFAEAATIPICFLTVQHALLRLARMKPGERVLIHAASGGVGLAAIQIAKQVGAEIFATAGSERKREYLRSLGIRHVFDSRTVDFADRVREATGGEGVDLVLNSLTGETIQASLSVLRAGGRFLELGKTDLWDQARVDAVRPSVTFFPIALDRMMADEPAAVRSLLDDVIRQFAEKKLQPLPLRTFAMPRAIDALRHMARAEHIGKVVVEAVPETVPPQETLALRDDATYLVTGGLGGLGLKLARWLIDRGAQHLALIGRSGVSDENRSQFEALSHSGVTIAVRQCNVGNRGEVAAMLDEIRREMPPLAGVFHLAGTLDDGVLREQTRERFDRVMDAKARGAWHLHELTRDEPLDLFVLFSSAAALMGSPGQGNYAAANAFLDALSYYRRSLKLPALSVNWGSWDEVGMAARLKESEGQRWAAAGIGWIGVEQGLATLERLILDGHTQAAVLPINWPKFFERIPPGSEPGWLAEIAQAASSAGGSEESGPPELLEKLQAAEPAERLEIAVAALRQQAARVLAMDEANLPDPRRTLNELGFDSLTGVEFCNRVSRAAGRRLNPTVLFDYPTLESLARYVVRELLELETAVDISQQTNSMQATEDDAAAALAAVEDMSEEEMDALVTAQLGRLEQ